MRERYFLAAALLLLFPALMTGCKGKVEEEPSEVKVGEVLEEISKPAPPEIGPHGAGDIRKWIESEAKKADAETIKEAEKVAGKFTAEEIVAGMAVRPIPDYWGNIPEEDKLKTVSIINTGLSKARIEAGLAEDADVFNSTIYITDKNDRIIAVSAPESGTHLYAAK